MVLRETYLELLMGSFYVSTATTSLVPGAEEERLVHTDALPVN